MARLHSRVTGQTPAPAGRGADLPTATSVHVVSAPYEAGAVRTGGPRRRLEIPPVGRSAAAFARRRQLPTVRGDEREGAVQRAVRHGHHAQRSAHDRRLGADENRTACGRLTSGRTAGDEQGEDEDGGTPWHGTTYCRSTAAVQLRTPVGSLPPGRAPRRPPLRGAEGGSRLRRGLRHRLHRAVPRPARHSGSPGDGTKGPTSVTFLLVADYRA